MPSQFTSPIESIRFISSWTLLCVIFLIFHLVKILYPLNRKHFNNLSKISLSSSLICISSHLVRPTARLRLIYGEIRLHLRRAVQCKEMKILFKTYVLVSKIWSKFLRHIRYTQIITKTDCSLCTYLQC